MNIFSNLFQSILSVQKRCCCAAVGWVDGKAPLLAGASEKKNIPPGLGGP